MTELSTPAARVVRPATPLEPGAHYRLYFYSAVLRLMRHATSRVESWREMFDAWPFLAEYNNEVAAAGLRGVSAHEAPEVWRAHVERRERDSAPGLPLLALRDAFGLEHEDLALFVACHLCDEDARFGEWLAQLQGNGAAVRPTLAILRELGEPSAPRDRAEARIERLEALGLLETDASGAPRAQRAYSISRLLELAVRGARPAALPEGWSLHDPPALPALEEVRIADRVREEVGRLPALGSGEPGVCVVVRGAESNGRRTVLRALARRAGLGTLEAAARPLAESARPAAFPALAVLCGALPVLVANPGPGEVAAIPEWPGYRGSRGIVLGRVGALSGAAVEEAVVLDLELPSLPLRRQLWRDALGAAPEARLDELARAYRVPSGRIRRIARLAASQSPARGGVPARADLERAFRTLGVRALESLATRLEAEGDWSALAVDGDTLADLRALEARCRHRENLAGALPRAAGGPPHVGFKALLQGPSGTGKTMAARLLAAVLGKPIWRAELSSIVNKYVGESEKRLHELLSAAEEHDVVLLFDEGDSLLAPRTGVRNSTDRYANLETNYLLQRLDDGSYEGILLVTTNSAERLDRAFERRMDAVISFRAPGPEQRRAIWDLHLPGGHRVDRSWLDEVALRCALNGAQIKGAATGATLAAVAAGERVGREHLEGAIRREYRKAGAACPLLGGSYDVGTGP